VFQAESPRLNGSIELTQIKVVGGAEPAVAVPYLPLRGKPTGGIEAKNKAFTFRRRRQNGFK
jgi:hypothetical protein